MLLCCVHLVTPKWHSPMTLGLLVFPPSCCPEWNLAGFCIYFLPDPGERSSYGGCFLFPTPASLCDPGLNAAVLAKAGWASVVCLGSDSIRWLIIPSWVALRNSGWVHHHVHHCGPKTGGLGQGALVVFFIAVLYPFPWSHLMEM